MCKLVISLSELAIILSLDDFTKGVDEKKSVNLNSTAMSAWLPVPFVVAKHDGCANEFKPQQLVLLKHRMLKARKSTTLRPLSRCPIAAVVAKNAATQTDVSYGSYGHAVESHSQIEVFPCVWDRGRWVYPG